MNIESTNYIMVFVTCPEEKAGEFSASLVTSNLAACVNILPNVRSIYTWKGEVCDDKEALLVIKSRASLFEVLKENIIELHPYEVPEVIALPIIAGHEPYLKWLEDCTQS